MKGVTNTIKEFSEDFYNLCNIWKYVVEQDDEGVNIKYMEKRDDKWEEINAMNITFTCANKLFKEIAKSLDTGEFTEDY